jgi:hypothetical protein
MSLPTPLERLRPLLGRLLFALLSTAVVIIFSEKLYWYVTGYVYFELFLGYFLPTFAFLTVVDAFRIRRLAPLFLAAAVYGYLVEGVIVPVIYEDGLFGWFGASYTPLAWHAPLSIIFGWYLLRRWLVAGNGRALALGSAAVGLYLGLWSLAWWLPENMADPDLLAGGARLGPWPVWEFAAHAFLFSALLILAHLLLGRGGWRPRFRPSRIELILLAAGLLFFFITQVLLVVPWAPLKLGALLAAALIPLALHRRRAPDGSLLADLDGRIPPARALPIFLMPGVAVAVYALATAINPSTDVLYVISTFGQVLGSAVFGVVAFVVAIVLTLRPRRADAGPTTTTEPGE